MDKLITIITVVIWLIFLLLYNLGYINTTVFRVGLIILGILYLIFFYRNKFKK